MALGHVNPVARTDLAENPDAPELTGVIKARSCGACLAASKLNPRTLQKRHAKTGQPDKFATITEIAGLFTSSFAFVI